MDDLLEFLDHAGQRGLMPAATAQAFAVASRNVLGVLSENERQDLGQTDLDSVIKRFSNKRAKDFNPSSLKEYGRRVQRAVELFLQWRADPANFTVKTRTTSPRKKGKNQEPSDTTQESDWTPEIPTQARPGTYHSSIPVRPGVVVTFNNIPNDLTIAEADRLASFVRMLALNAPSEIDPTS